MVVEEKVDGSQVTFGIQQGELCIRSKGAEINPEAPDSMFAPGVEQIKAVRDRLVEGIHYRGEYLRKPKHNVLAYDRIPNGHIALFDLDNGQGEFLERSVLEHAARDLGMDCVPELYRGTISLGADAFAAFLERQSFLGGQLIEGVVIKPEGRNLFGEDKKLLMAKLVRPEFKEMHRKDWKTSNPRAGDIVQLIGQSLRTPARWHKAVQHLRDAGRLKGAPEDIGPLMKEVPSDILKEEGDAIREQLFKWAWPKIHRIANAGLAEWYKALLVSSPDSILAAPDYVLPEAA